jgi:ribosomal protein S18 acetylase RimI-like enzyme
VNIRYEINPSRSSLPAESVLKLLKEAGICSPLWTAERLDRALQNSQLVVCAWNDGELVGYARVITDFAWFAYLSQLAVKPASQNNGIGKELVARAREQIGDEAGLLVHSTDAAANFYLAAGFEPYANFFRLPRKR